jgi:arylsulfatase A-like enzyme
MLTSRYPREHGVLNNATALSPSELSLAEILGEKGYRTAGFMGVQLLNRGSGASQGFDTFDAPSETKERRADTVVLRALQWLDGLDADERFLLWVHLFDPHMPYAPPPGFRGGVSRDRPELTWNRLEEIAAEHGGHIPAEVLEEARMLYRGEISFVDWWVGELISGLAARRSIDDTLIVFTADHGECFESGIFFEHSDCLWEAGIAIPMIVRYPHMFPPGERVDVRTSIIDVAPTALRAAGFAIPEQFSGRPMQERGAFAERHVMLQYPFYQPSAAEKRTRRRQIIRSVAGQPTGEIFVDQEKVGVVGREWKYLRAGDREELYQVAPIVGEPKNEIDSHRSVADRMRTILQHQLEEHPLTLIQPAVINDELRQTLEALGYL